MANQQPYTDAEKKRALDLYVLYGPCRASRETGIHKGTITRWAKKLGLETKSLVRMAEANEAREARITSKRLQLKELLISKAVDLARRMDEPHIDFKGSGNLGPTEVEYPKAPAAACQNYATSIGILIDKFRLENGEVTGREEVVTVDAVDREIQRLEAELARRATVDARTAEAN